MLAVEPTAGLLPVPGHVGREIADPLDVGNDLERRGDKPEIACDRLLEREQFDTVALDVEIPAVDIVVALDDPPGLRPVTGLQDIQRGPVPLQCCPGHLDNVVPEERESGLVGLTCHSLWCYPNFPVM